MNGIECCGPPCEEELVFLSNLCGDADRDGVPDYLDSDSDDDGYSDAIECPLSEDGVLACNHNDSPLLDFREMNDADDYDMDGLTNSLECGAGGLTDDCADTDRDGYRDFRDRDSDGDGLTDGLECPQPDNPEGCRDSDEDGIPDWRQGGDPARCECPSLSVETLCRADAFGPYCTQEVRDLPETLTWLGPEGDFGAEASSIAPFDTFSVPGGAWRCEAEEPCDESTGDRIAVLRIEEDGTVVGYVIDSRSIDPGALLPAELVVRDLDIQLGRFLYGLAGGPQPSL